nr:hypothetical protein [Tanacetum cinerariifolium]
MRFYWGSDEEPKAPEEALPSPNYMPEPEHLLSPDYVPGPEHPPSSDYVPEPECPKIQRRTPSRILQTILSMEETMMMMSHSMMTMMMMTMMKIEDTKAFETDESTPTPPSPRPRRAGIYVRLSSPMAASMKAHITEYAAAPTPSLAPPSTLTPILSPLTQIPSPSLPVPSPPTTSPTYAEAPLGYRAAEIRLRVALPSTHHPSEIPLPPLFKVGESSAIAAARHPGLEDVWDDMVGDMEERAPTLEDLSQRVTGLGDDLARDTHEMHVHFEDAQDNRALLRARAIDCNRAVHAELLAYRAQTSSLQTQLTTALGRIQTLEAREPTRTDNPKDAESDQVEKYFGGLPDMIQGSVIASKPNTMQEAIEIANDLMDQKVRTNRTSRNGDDNHDSGTGSRRTERAARECTYSDFLKSQPLNFKGTEGVVGLTQWFERTESVFHISNYVVRNQIKLATCNLLGSALTWWNSYVKVVELALMCGKMFPEESNQVEKYFGGLPDMIQGSVIASKPNTMQEAIKIANDPMNQKKAKDKSEKKQLEDVLIGRDFPEVKENQEKDKNRSKPDKIGKRGEAGKSQKQLQLKEEEKPKKTKKEWPKTHARIKSY